MLISALALTLLSGCLHTADNSIELFKAGKGVNFINCGNIDDGERAPADRANSLACAQKSYAQCTPMDVREWVYDVNHSDDLTKFTYLTYADDSGNCQVTLFISAYLGDGSYVLIRQDCARLRLPDQQTETSEIEQDINVFDCGEEQDYDVCKRPWANGPC